MLESDYFGKCWVIKNKNIIIFYEFVYNILW